MRWFAYLILFSHCEGSIGSRQYWNMRLSDGTEINCCEIYRNQGTVNIKCPDGQRYLNVVNMKIVSSCQK